MGPWEGKPQCPLLLSCTFLIHGPVEVGVPLHVFPFPARRTLDLILVQDFLPVLWDTAGIPTKQSQKKTQGGTDPCSPVPASLGPFGRTHSRPGSGTAPSEHKRGQTQGIAPAALPGDPPSPYPPTPHRPYHVGVGIGHLDPLPPRQPDLVLENLLHEAQVPGVRLVQQPGEQQRSGQSPPKLCNFTKKTITHVFSGQMNQSPAQVQPVEGRKLSLGSLILPVTSEYLGYVRPVVPQFPTSASLVWFSY